MFINFRKLYFKHFGMTSLNCFFFFKVLKDKTLWFKVVWEGVSSCFWIKSFESSVLIANSKISFTNFSLSIYPSVYLFIFLYKFVYFLFPLVILLLEVVQKYKHHQSNISSLPLVLFVIPLMKVFKTCPWTGKGANFKLKKKVLTSWAEQPRKLKVRTEKYL